MMESAQPAMLDEQKGRGGTSMHPIHKLLTAVAAAASLPFSALPAHAATLGGADFATQYDFREFYSATDNKAFRVVLLGNPFPNIDMGEMARRLLPVMQ